MAVSRRQQLIAGAVAVAVAGVAGVFVTRGGGPDAADAAPSSSPVAAGLSPTSSTTTVPATTTKPKPKKKPEATPKATTTKATGSSGDGAGGAAATPPAPDGPAPRSGAGPYKVATAKGSAVEVQLATPSGAADQAPKLDARPAFAGDQRATPPLPRLEQPVQGRFATEGGYRFDNPQPFGDVLTFLVVRQSGEWLQVQLPVRPNGTMGWIKASDVEVSEVTAHVEINVAERTLRIFEGSSMVDQASVAVGTSATRTPTGRHFLTDRLAEPGGSQKAPWSLGISAYSEQLDTFDGGAPQIAVHGWRDASVFGQARSNGCIRAPSDMIHQLAALPLGTPVDVYAS